MAIEALSRDRGLWAEIRLRGEKALLSSKPAIFLDRDGVVIEEKHYLHRPDDVELTPDAGRAIARLNALAYHVVMITNQAGIGRGIFGWQDFSDVQDEVHARLSADGAHIDAVYACAYHGEGKPPFQHTDHAWRKPNTGMIEAAAQDLRIDLARSWVIGDRASDLEAGLRAGLKGGILVSTGYGADAIEIDDIERLRSDRFEIRRSASLADAIEGLLRA